MTLAIRTSGRIMRSLQSVVRSIPNHPPNVEYSRRAVTSVDAVVADMALNPIKPGATYIVLPHARSTSDFDYAAASDYYNPPEIRIPVGDALYGVYMPMLWPHYVNQEDNICLSGFDTSLPIGTRRGGVVVCFLDLYSMVDMGYEVTLLEGTEPVDDPRTRHAKIMYAVLDALVTEVAKGQREQAQAEALRYAKIQRACKERRLTESQRRLADTEAEIKDKFRSLEGLHALQGTLRRDINEARRDLRAPARDTRNARRDYNSLIRIAETSLEEITIGSDKLEVLTKPVHIEYHGYEYELGKYEFALALDSSVADIRIIPAGGGVEAEGYHHPHISGDTPCLGNIGRDLRDAMNARDLVGALALILEFLNSYNDGNPYIEIEKFHPDFNDDEHERCYDNATRYDCATCNDDSCTYHDSAQETCYEDRDYIDCVGCNDCPMWESAVDGCVECNYRECLRCRHTFCPHARNYDSCQDYADSTECDGCTETECPRHAAHNQPEEGEENAA